MKRLTAALLLLALLWSAPSASAAEPPDLHTQAAKAKAEVNEDVVGYLMVPGTLVSDLVVQGPADDRNSYYLRRNNRGEYDFNGSLFADYRCGFDTGLSQNTVIYGFGDFTDNPDGKMLGSLNRYRDLGFCKENPVLYFATTRETIAWEIFAVAVLDIYLPYNRPDLGPEEWAKTLEEVKSRSMHELGVAVTAADQVLTLSTLDFSLSATYPNDYRLVVMAKRIDGTAASPQSEPDPGPDTGWVPHVIK